MFINCPRAQKTPQILWDWDSGSTNSTVENRGRGGRREAGEADLRLTRALSDMEEGGMVGDGQGGMEKEEEEKKEQEEKEGEGGQGGVGRSNRYHYYYYY